MKNRKQIALVCGLALLLASALSACSGDDQKAGGPPPPLVQDMTLALRDQPMTFEYMGQTAGAREIQVTARTGGILLERKYLEGSFVEENDLLFTIDPEKSDANLAQTAGELARQKASLENSRRERDRIVKLYADGAVSAQERDNAVTAYESALASVQESAAKVRDARISLNYNEVRAPISGMTSKETVSEGSLIIANTSVLTAITQLDPLYVNFSVPGSEALRTRRWRAEGKMVIPEDGFTLRIKLVDGTMYERLGHINFSDKKVDPATGSIRIRGQFANPESMVLPGQYVRVFVEGGVLKDALIIPQRAVLFTQKGPMAYVLDENNIASPRPLELGVSINDDFVVESGLKPGDRIVSEGVIKVRPGSPVSVAPAQAKDASEEKATPEDSSKPEKAPTTEGGDA
ncbi:MAG: efflux RND transporter periplasmic adaptor subunit [Desulfovibrionaceae bacterium]